MDSLKNIRIMPFDSFRPKDMKRNYPIFCDDTKETCSNYTEYLNSNNQWVVEEEKGKVAYGSSLNELVLSVKERTSWI